MTTRVTKKAWFGPKKYVGWGWRIVSWEGRLTTAVLVGLLVVGVLAWPHSRLLVVASFLVVFGVVVLLTGDRPGGPANGVKRPRA